jgi:hypothetical protein
MREFKLRVTEIDDHGRTKTLKYSGPTLKIEIDDNRIDPTDGRVIDRKAARIKITIPVNDLELARIRYKKRNLVVL